jgi:hypothetical protein
VTDEDVFDSILQFNYTHDNFGAGYIVGSGGMTQVTSERVVVRYNISQNDCRQDPYGGLLLESWQASDIDVYNNTVYLDAGSYSAAGAIAFTYLTSSGTPQPFTVHVYNNIFDTAPGVPVVAMTPVIQPVAQRLTFRANNYFSGDGKPILIQWGNTAYNSLDGANGFRTLQLADGTYEETLANGTPVGTVATPGLSKAGQAPAIMNIDNMSQELVPYYQLTSAADQSVKTGGLDLFGALGLQWDPALYWEQQTWFPSATWNNTPTDFFAVRLNQPFVGPFGIGASEFR